MIAGLVEPNAGDILLDGRPITRVPVHRRNVGMLFQNYALFPHMTSPRTSPSAWKRAASNAPPLPSASPDALAAGAASGIRRPHAGAAVGRAAAARGAGPCAGGRTGRCCCWTSRSGALDKALRESMQVELRALQQRLGITTDHGDARPGRGADDGGPHRHHARRPDRAGRRRRPRFISVRSRASSPAFSAPRTSCAAGWWMPRTGECSSTCRGVRSCRSRRHDRLAARSRWRSGPRP